MATILVTLPGGLSSDGVQIAVGHAGAISRACGAGFRSQCDLAQSRIAAGHPPHVRGGHEAVNGREFASCRVGQVH